MGTFSREPRHQSELSPLKRVRGRQQKEEKIIKREKNRLRNRKSKTERKRKKKKQVRDYYLKLNPFPILIYFPD